MEKHINIIGTLYIVLSLLGLLSAFLLYFVLRLIGTFSEGYEANVILSTIANIVTIVFITLSIPGLIGGIGLIRRKNWARILILIISILNLFNFPLGTALGIYAIWALVQPEIIGCFETRESPSIQP